MSALDLKNALDRFLACGATVEFWLRDDDTVAPTPALERLLSLGAKFSVPITLAVIPEKTGQPLVDYLASCPLAEVTVHGWSHRSHAREGEKKQELGAHRPAAETLEELRTGFDKLQGLHGQRFTPMLVPPWNRIAPAVIDGLPDIGFQALSTFGPEQRAPLIMLNSHVDIIDWRGTRGGRASDILLAEVVALLETPGRQPIIGILAHHLVHDEQAWQFLETLMDLTTRHHACRWRSARDRLKDALPGLPGNQQTIGAGRS